MRAIFRDQNGRFSSALAFRFVWHIACLAGWVWYGFAREAGLEWLAFAAVMAGAEGFSYNWRRGQDRKAEASRPAALGPPSS